MIILMGCSKKQGVNGIVYNDYYSELGARQAKESKQIP